MQESLPTGSAAALAGDIFLHVKTRRAGKIKGEASAPEHADDIVVNAWSWGVAAGSAIGSGQATSRRSYKHLAIVKRIDSASTGLMSALATNDEVLLNPRAHLAEARLEDAKLMAQAQGEKKREPAPQPAPQAGSAPSGGAGT